MPSIVNEKGTEMMDFSTTGDERTIEHTAKLKLSIQEIACLVEDEERDDVEDCDARDVDDGHVVDGRDVEDAAEGDDDDLIVNVGDDFLPSPPHSLVPHSLEVRKEIPDEENLIIDVVNNEKQTVPSEQNSVEFPISSDINTKIQLLEDEVISKRRARNRSRILYFCKTIVFYIFLFYLFFIPNMILVFVYHEQFLLFFGNEKKLIVANHTFYGRDGQSGQDGQNGRDGQNGQDGQNGRDGQNGQDGQSGQDGTVFNISELTNNITNAVTNAVTKAVTSNVNNNIISTIEQQNTINFRNVIVDNLLSTNITATNTEFVSVDAQHYTGSTFNNCIQGTC